jgi:Bacterial alpha-L-rhamnosidase C-terminal domain
VPRYVSPFVSYQELRAYAAQADAADSARALDLIRRTWAPMLHGTDSGLMWENTSLAGRPQLGSYTSLAHGWSAGPTAYLTNEVLGVTPTSGGFATASVLPHLATGLDWAEGRVPTPHGDLESAWKQADGGFTLRVAAPAGTTVTAGVPVAGVHEVSLNGQAVWRDGQALRDGVALRDGYVQVDGLTGTTELRAN